MFSKTSKIKQDKLKKQRFRKYFVYSSEKLKTLFRCIISVSVLAQQPVTGIEHKTQQYVVNDNTVAIFIHSVFRYRFSS